MVPYFYAMASSSGSSDYCDFCTSKSAKPSQVLVLRDFTIVRTSSALQPVGDTDVEIVTAEKRVVMAPACLSFMYSELQKEIEYLGNVILELQRQEQNSWHIAPDICAPYELALQYQWQLDKSESAKP